jgi:hypothetical protein
MKRNVPLEARIKLQTIIDENRDLVEPVDNPSVILHLVESVSNSPFFFTVEKQNQNAKYLVKYMPQHSSTLTEGYFEYDIDDVAKTLKSWFNLLKGYKESRWIHDDHAQKKFEDFFYEEYKVDSEDADYAPFNPPQILRIAGAIENIKTFVDTHQALFDSHVTVEAIKQDCDKLTEELPTKAQNRVIKAIASIYARIIKVSISMMKKFNETAMPEVQQVLIEKGVEKVIELVSN